MQISPFIHSFRRALGADASSPAKQGPRMLAAVVFGLALLAPAAPTHAWKSTGHRVVAQIAWERLEERDRKELSRLIGLLGDLEAEEAGFVSAAIWMDQLKWEDMRLYDRWHYVNRPFLDGVESAPEVDSDNILWALGRARDALASPKGGDLGRALALRFLLHLVGDVHQPMHCATRFTRALPGGDRGGNDFLLQGEKHGVTLSSLHDLWDRAAFLFEEPPGAGKGGQARIRRLARKVTRAFPPEDLPGWRQPRMSAWVDESFRLAVSHAYAGIEEGGEPSEDYLAQAQKVNERRIALAGYRLAMLLEDALAASRSAKEPSGGGGG